MALSIAVLAVLLCVAYGQSLNTVEFTTTVSYPSGNGAFASGGSFYGVPAGNTQVGMWTANPATAYILTWELAQLLNSSDVSTVQSVPGANITSTPTSTTPVSFFTAAQDANYLYLVDQTNVFKVDPLNLDATAPNMSLGPIFTTQLTCALLLSNETSSYLIIGAFGPTQLAVVDLLHAPWDGSQVTVLTPNNPINDLGPGGAINVDDNYGYLLYTTSTSLVLGRVYLNSSTLEPVPAINIEGLYINSIPTTPSVYDEEDGILYMAVQTAELIDGVRYLFSSSIFSHRSLHG